MSIVKLRAMVDSERLRQSAVGILEEMESDSIRTFADALLTIADAIDEAKQYVEEWAETEDKEEKSDARVNALEAIESVCNMADYDIGDAVVPQWLDAQLIHSTEVE